MESMIEFLVTMSWTAVLQIIMIDILLGGDNAVVIALACRSLPKHQRMKGIIWGTAGAIVLRVILIVFAVSMLQMPFLKLIGGALLFWIGVKLLVPESGHGHKEVAAGITIMAAVRTIIIADLVMSVDNVIAIAGAAQQADPDHQIGLVVFGLLVSIPIIVWGSQLVISLIERYPIVIWIGGALLGWIAGGMMITDVWVVRTFGAPAMWVKYAADLIGVLFVVGLAKWLLARSAARAP